MKKTQLKKNHRVFTKYLISFIVGFAIPSIFIIVFFNRYTSEIIYKKAENNINAKYLQKVDDIEKKINEVIDAVVKLSVDEETRILGGRIIMDSEDYFRLNQYSLLLSRHILLSDLIKSISVYYNNTDIVISQLGKQGLYSFINQFHNSEGIKSEYMEELLKKTNNRFIIPLADIETGHLYSERFITMIQSFPINNNRTLGSIIVSLERDALMQFTGESNTKASENLIIVDNEANILACANTNLIPKKLRMDIINKNTNVTQHIEISGVKQLVFCQKSKINDWWYIFYLPQEDIKSNLVDFEKLLLKILILYIVFGFSISLFLALFNYNPIRGLLNEIDNKFSNNGHNIFNKYSSKSKSDEFGVIQNFINDLYNEKNKLDSEMNNYMNDVRNNFLREITIEVVDHDKFKQMTKLLNLKFIYNRYCCLYFVLYSKHSINKSKMNEHVVILAAIEEWGSKFGTGCKFYIGKDSIGFVLNITDDITLNDIVKSYRELVSYINLNYSQQLRTGISNMYEGYDKIPVTNKEADEAVKYSILYDCELFSYAEVESIEHNKNNYPDEIMNKLLKNVNSGNLVETESVLSELLDFHFKNKKLPINTVKKVFDDIIEKLNKATEKYNIDNNSFLEELNLNIYSNHYICLSDIIDKTIKTFKDTCLKIVEVKEKFNNDTTSDIIGFINRNYCEHSLSCNCVAEKFKLSQTYLSNILKQHTGMNYGDYVNRLRIQKAKELFNYDNLSINDIAEKLGYSSGNSFIRTFKSFEGITPGQYRNLYV